MFSGEEVPSVVDSSLLSVSIGVGLGIGPKSWNMVGEGDIQYTPTLCYIQGEREGEGD